MDGGRVGGRNGWMIKCLGVYVNMVGSLGRPLQLLATVHNNTSINNYLWCRMVEWDGWSVYRWWSRFNIYLLSDCTSRSYQVQR